VLAETFLVAWRRLDDIPQQALPWLLAVARRVLANLRRSEKRRVALTNRLARDRTAVPAAGVPGGAGVAVAVRAALDQLRDRDREILMLAEWDGLEPQEIARMLSCSRANVDVRLHRARRRIAALLTAAGYTSVRHSPVEPVPAWTTGDGE
jgi:RNA polymerase sigma-70 factor, ECF subfamily